MSLKSWYLLHKWSSLVSTVFLLVLCVTGLPLIFHEEIDHLTSTLPEPAAGPATADLDAMVAEARARHPDETVLYVSFDEHEPVVFVAMAPTTTATLEEMRWVAFGAHDGALLGAPEFNEGVMYVLFKLHTDLFAGLPGMLFLGSMGLLMVIAIVSGVVLYAPFMRKLPFGTVRAGRTARMRWLDLHNLLGVVTVVWAAVVALTGAVNTLAMPILQLWQYDQLADIVAHYADRPAPARESSLSEAVALARRSAPGMEPSFIGYPGTPFSSRHHYAVFMRGDSPLTSRLLKPALVDVESGGLTAMRTMPWYATLLFVSQPLHFGDYGGMAMKILWALLDLVTIVVLGSGLYLWYDRRRVPLELRIAALAAGEAERLPPPERPVA